MCVDLLTQTKMVAKVINIERVLTLSGTLADLNNPDYIRLKAQMAAIKEASDKGRFVYLMARQPDNSIIFLVDNEPPDSADYSAPGDYFSEASAELVNAFDTGLPFVEGPEKDQWGNWISAVVPLQDPQTGDTIALFGMDIDANTWQREVILQTMLPVGMIIGSFILLVLIIMLWHNRSILSSNQRELLEVKNFNESIVQNAAEGILIADQAGYIIFANPALEDMLGYHPSEMIGKNWMIYVPPDMKKRALRADQERTKGKSERYELALLHKDGTPVPLQISASPRYDQPNGNYIGSLAVMTNISALQKAEKAIRESEVKYRLIFERSPLGFLHFNREGIITNCNANFVEIVGSSYKKLIGVNLLLLPDQGIVRAVKKALEGEIATYEDNYSSVTANKVTPVRAIFAPIKSSDDGNSQVSGGIGIIEDITERKKAEEKVVHMSLHDQLTDLYNRHFLEAELKRLDTERQLPFSIVMADVNGLKLVNDTYGHLVGDQLLCRAADIIKRNSRNEDIVARWGGDEFIILLPRTDHQVAEHFTRRIRESCAGEDVEDFPVSIALGAATRTTMAVSLKTTLKKAEDNMYEQKLTESRSTKNAVLTALLNTLAAKSFETEAHTHNMQDIAIKIARVLNLPESEINRLILLITLHDIGKINIPEEILTKREPLTEEEWLKMRKHPETGYRIALATEEFAHVAEDILCHHERYDGKGYPRGLSGEKIPLLARIAAIADAYEVMRNGRPYKEAMPLSEIKQEFRVCSGTQFDPALVNILLKLLEEDN